MSDGSGPAMDRWRWRWSAALAAACCLAAPALAAGDCAAGPAGAAAANAASYERLAWSPFGRPETGWQVYYPRIAVEIGTPCQPGSPGFALALAAWQQAHRAPPTGVVDVATFTAMKQAWQEQRPFVQVSGRNICPPPPPQRLAVVAPGEGFGGKAVALRNSALAAWRRMVAAAKAALPDARRDPRAFTIFSGFRDPVADARRCATEHNCNGVVRATCSAHRTGLAMDLWVGQAPGYGPDSSADPNRRYMVTTEEYRWLVANARRYGFVNYVFEPWHWEWTGEPI